MKYFIDGDQLCITKDNFVNLQESPAVFYSLDSEIAKTVLSSRRIIALPVGDLRSIHEALDWRADDSIVVSNCTAWDGGTEVNNNLRE